MTAAGGVGFTPGPWTIHPRFVEEDGSVSPAHVASADGRCVCFIEAAVVAEIAIKNPGTIWDISPVRVANARLIEAAPDLLEALLPFAHLDLRPDGFDKRDDSQPVYARDNSVITVGDVRRAVAAIAKATTP